MAAPSAASIESITDRWEATPPGPPPGRAPRQGVIEDVVSVAWYARSEPYWAFSAAQLPGGRRPGTRLRSAAFGSVVLRLCED